MVYTDPGSGALLWQLAGSAVFGLMFYVGRVGHWIGRKLRHSEPALPEQKRSH